MRIKHNKNYFQLITTVRLFRIKDPAALSAALKMLSTDFARFIVLRRFILGYVRLVYAMKIKQKMEKTDVKNVPVLF